MSGNLTRTLRIRLVAAFIQSTRRREQMSRKAIIAVVCGIVAIFLLEVFAVLAWA